MTRCLQRLPAHDPQLCPRFGDVRIVAVGIRRRATFAGLVEDGPVGQLDPRVGQLELDLAHECTDGGELSRHAGVERVDVDEPVAMRVDARLVVDIVGIQVTDELVAVVDRVERVPVIAEARRARRGIRGPLVAGHQNQHDTQEDNEQHRRREQDVAPGAEAPAASAGARCFGNLFGSG